MLYKPFSDQRGRQSHLELPSDFVVARKLIQRIIILFILTLIPSGCAAATAAGACFQRPTIHFQCR